MSKARVLLAIVTGCAVWAATSASAMAAPQYYIEHTAFTGSASTEAGIVTGGSMVLVSKLTGGATLELKCSKLKLTSSTIENNNKGKEKAIVFEGCKVATPVTCKVSETLTTNEIVSEAVDTGTEGVSFVFKPKGETSFITISITGCSGEGNYAVTGSAECEVSHPATAEVDKECSFTSTSGSALKFGTNAASFIVKIILWLIFLYELFKWFIKP